MSKARAVSIPIAMLAVVIVRTDPEGFRIGVVIRGLVVAGIGCSQSTRACTDMRNQHAHENSACGQLDTREGFEAFEVKQISREENFTRGPLNRFVPTKTESPSEENSQLSKKR